MANQQPPPPETKEPPPMRRAHDMNPREDRMDDEQDRPGKFDHATDDTGPANKTRTRE